MVFGRSFLFILFIAALAVNWVDTCQYVFLADISPKLSLQRLPAMSGQEILEEIFSIKMRQQSNVNTKLDLEKQFRNTNNIIYSWIPAYSLANDVGFKIELDVVGNRFVFKIYHTPQAFEDSESSKELSRVLMTFSNRAFAELYYNARAGDIEAISILLKIRHQISEQHPDTQFQMKQRLLEIAPELERSKQERSSVKAKQELVQRDFDDAPNELQLKELVARNDRKGVVKLLKKYLPLQTMGPFERKFWELHLEAMQSPVPFDQRVVIYRGMRGGRHNDVMGIDGISRDEAIRDTRGFIFSNMFLDGKEHNWNRQLKSLGGNRNGDVGLMDYGVDNQSSSLSTLFANHAGSSKGSPMISFTPDFNVASHGTRRIAILIDPRLLHYNFMSHLLQETEFFVPLFVFPDEVVGIWDHAITENKSANDYFKQQLEKLIERYYGKTQGLTALNKIQEQTKEYFRPFLFSNIDRATLNLPYTPNKSLFSVFKDFSSSHTKSSKINKCIDLYR